MKLLLIRHGESMGNATGNYSIATSDSLSQKGKEQALATVPFLQSQSFEKIIVSPLSRAQETIAPYLKAEETQAEIWPEISEACWHEEKEPICNAWKTEAIEIATELKSFFTFKNDEAVRPLGDEPYGEGLKRVHSFVEYIKASSKKSDGTFLMVSHGHFIREFLKMLFETSNTVGFHQDNCGATLLSYNGDWTMEYSNRPIMS